MRPAVVVGQESAHKVEFDFVVLPAMPQILGVEADASIGTLLQVNTVDVHVHDTECASLGRLLAAVIQMRGIALGLQRQIAQILGKRARLDRVAFDVLEWHRNVTHTLDNHTVTSWQM